MNCFKFLHLNNLPVTKGMAHNSNLLFLLNYLRKKNYIIAYLQVQGIFREYFRVFLEHIICIFIS
jgi:hypothetical protein